MPPHHPRNALACDARTQQLGHGPTKFSDPDYATGHVTLFRINIITITIQYDYVYMYKYSIYMYKQYTVL